MVTAARYSQGLLTIPAAAPACPAPGLDESGEGRRRGELSEGNLWSVLIQR